MGQNVDSTLSVIAGDGGPSKPRPQPALLILLESSRPWAGSSRHLLRDIDVIEIGRGTERTARRGRAGDKNVLTVTVPDRWMSSQHARIEHRFGRWLLTDLDSKNGTSVGGEPVRSSVIGEGSLIEVGHTLLRFRLALDASEGGDDVALDIDSHAITRAGALPDGMVTVTPTLERELAQARRLAGASDIAFLIRGESGTGKEVLARAVHQLSSRAGDLIAVNCGAIPANLIESELFGHVRGAFSGAAIDKLGLIRAADRGTLMLDEIGDLALPSQTALLRVLQEREVLPVGATKPSPVDIRVLSATHRDLDAMVTAGTFRGDLYARLAGYTVSLPPLRERPDDLGVLIAALFRRLVSQPEAHPGLSIEAARVLASYHWPMNIRELEGALRAAEALSGGKTIETEHLPVAVRDPSAVAPAMSEAEAKDAELRAVLEAKLADHKGNISAVARAIGKDRKQVQRWLKRLNIDVDGYR